MHLNFIIYEDQAQCVRPGARVHRRLPKVEMTEVEVHMALTPDGRLPTGNTNLITTVVEVISGKGHS